MAQRKKVVIDKLQMKELGYRPAPIKQVLNLNLNNGEKLILLNFFSNSDEWELSIKGISKSFDEEANRKTVRAALSKFKTLGYLTETDEAYTIRLDIIQRDYVKMKENKKNMSRTGIKSTTGTDFTTDQKPTRGDAIISNTDNGSKHTTGDGKEDTTKDGIDYPINNNNITKTNNEKQIIEDFNKQISLDHSQYFDSAIQLQLAKLYNTNTFKTELSYNQFESQFLFCLVDRYSIEAKKEFDTISREFIMNLLNTKFDIIAKFVLPLLTSEIIQIFKKEESAVCSRLVRFKLSSNDNN